MTFSNLDEAVRQSVDARRSEAYALAMSAAPEPVPDDQNAAVDYLEMQESLQRGRPTIGQTSPEWPQIWLDAASEFRRSSRGDGASAFSFDFASAELGRWLEGRQGEILLMRRAAAKAGCDFGRNYGGLTWSMLLPEIEDMRQAVRLLGVDARHRAATGDVEGALADVQAMYGAAHHMANEPFGVTMLVAISSTTCRTIPCKPS